VAEVYRFVGDVGSPDIGVTGLIALKILERALDNVA